jgi:hypothetical protein
VIAEPDAPIILGHAPLIGIQVMPSVLDSIDN